MSLHDVDKSHERRVDPRPNAHDLIVNRLAHGTTQIRNTKDTSPTTEGKIKFSERQIIINDGSNDRILIGFLKDGF